MKVIVKIIGVAMSVYILLIMPRLTKQKEAKKFKNRYYAHRGLHDNKSIAPENSLLAFAYAVQSGYGIELDVQLTKDEILVVFHDDSIERVCGNTGNVSDYTYNELQEFSLFDTEEKIPTLNQVLRVIDGQVPVIVEIKMKGRDTRVCELVNKELGIYDGNYCIESFNPFAVRWYKKNKPNVIRGQLSSALNHECNKKDLGFFAVEHLLTNVLTRPDFIAYNHLFKNEMGRFICKNLFKCLSVTWTIKSVEELEKAKNDFDIFIFEGFIPPEIKCVNCVKK